MPSIRLAGLLALLCAALFGVVVGFRAFVYTHLYIAPDEPYGISDIIEVLLGFVLLGVLGLSVVAAVMLAIRDPKGNRIAALLLVGLVVLAALSVGPAHTLAARWSAR